mmetsp:Transcript_7855/g.13243  ORF Transcript_7855/g.13243 Transcript_7855/m.13243 type:complete len:621 (-) Transcript_7855:218-2080(-)
MFSTKSNVFPSLGTVVLLVLTLFCIVQPAVADVTVQHSYWERLQDAMYDFIAGCCLVFFSICLLMGTERQAIVYNVLLDRCQQATVIINDITSINPLNENKPVFISGSTYLENPALPDTTNVSGTLGDKDVGAGASRAGMSNILDEDTGYRCSTRQLAIRLRRRAEMYQWVEYEMKGEKQTTYRYSLEWREIDVSSGNFQESAGHYNPPRSPCVLSRSISHPSPVKVGAYTLAEQQIDLMRNYYSCSIPTSSLEHDRVSEGQHVERGASSSWTKPEPTGSYQQQPVSSHQTDYLVYNGSLHNPHPGTIRVSYEALMEGGEVSLVGVQQQLSREGAGSDRSPPFRPFDARDAQALEPWFLTVIFQITSGDCSCRNHANRGGANYQDERCCCLLCKICCCCCYLLSAFADMFSKAIVGDSVLLVEEKNTTLGTVFSDERKKLGLRILLMRLGGCLLLSIGIYMIFNPIAVILSFIPYVSGMLSNMFWVVALLLGFTLGALIIALSWILYRPLYFGVLSIALGLFLGPTNVDATTAWTSMAFLMTGMLSLLLALLYAIGDCHYSSAIEDERASRPVGHLEVRSADEEGYTQATSVSTSYPTSDYANASAPPLPVAKMQPMNIQ